MDRDHRLVRRHLGRLGDVASPDSERTELLRDRRTLLDGRYRCFFVRYDPELWFWSGEYRRGVEDLGYRELDVRWLQYRVFLPVFRSHGTDTPREVWRFGESSSVFYDTLRRFIQLRYRLIAYIYSVARKVTIDHYTVMRCLVFDSMHDRRTCDIRDQYLFGPSFLVNPVTEPMYYQPESKPVERINKTRAVYLREGSDWVDFWTGRSYAGGGTVHADALIEIMPLYVRSGAIIPIGPIVQHTGETSNGALEIWVYPGADDRFELYEDERENYNYEKGSYSVIVFRWDDRSGTLTIEDRIGSFEDMHAEREFSIVIVSVGHGAGIEEDTGIDGEITYDGSRLEWKRSRNK